MDVERTIEFILQMQAKAEARAAKAEVRMDKTDRQIQALGKIVKLGMRKLGDHEKEIKEIRQIIKATAEQQRRTERNLDRFIASMSSR